VNVALVSDTHLPRFGRALPAALLRGIVDARVERILHAGDWTQELAVELLERLAPVDGVAGNNDGPALHERFGTRRIVDLGGVRIGLVHGHIGPGSTTPERAARAFGPDDAVDAVVFGHSHIPVARLEAATAGARARWLVNPGSPTDRRRQPAFSWALLRIDAGRIVSVDVRTYPDRSA
jgi:putative phosphoesterase